MKLPYPGVISSHPLAFSVNSEFDGRATGRLSDIHTLEIGSAQGPDWINVVMIVARDDFSAQVSDTDGNSYRATTVGATPSEDGTSYLQAFYSPNPRVGSSENTVTVKLDRPLAFSGVWFEHVPLPPNAQLAAPQ